MNKFIPTVLYHSKLISLEQIKSNEKESQSRNQSVDTDNLKRIEQSISQIKLQNPIAVEVVFIDEQDEDKSEYKLRDGSHRFKAYESLQAKHKNTINYDKITCVVYEKHTGQDAASDWLQWQHQQNEHLEKTCRRNSFDDSVVTAYKLLVSGYLDKDAADLVANGNWANPLVNCALEDWISANCKGLSNNQREEMLENIHAKGGSLYNSKVKKYTRNDVRKLLVKNYDIPTKGRLPLTSNSANTTVWVATDQNWWTTALSPVYRVLNAGVKETRNDIVFHCRKGGVTQIDARRKDIKNMVNVINNWFSSNIPAFKHVKVIDDVKILGQKLAKQHGEKDGEFI